MADASKEPKIILEREYNVPLRKGWLKVPRYKRSNKAVKTMKKFLQKHMKSEDVRLGMHANEHIWKHGIKNPPHHVKVKAVKYYDGVVKAELEGFDFKEAIKAKAKEEKPTGLKGKLQSALGKTEDKSEEKTEEVTKKNEGKTKETKKDESKETQAKKPAKKTPKKSSATKKSSPKQNSEEK